MSYNHAQGDFILHLTTFVVTDIASLAAAATVVDGTDYTSYVLDVTDIDVVALQAKVTGVADSTGAIDYVILGTLDGVLWDTVAVATVSVTQAGAAKIVLSDPLDVRGYRAIKVGSVKNNDGSKTATLMNLKWGKSYGYIC